MLILGYATKRWYLHWDFHELTFLVGVQSTAVVTRGGTSGRLLDHRITSVYLGPFSLTFEKLWEKKRSN